MAYDYQTQRAQIFTEDGQVQFLKIRDAVNRLIGIAGAFRIEELMSTVCCGDSWLQIACVDRLVELGELIELHRDCWGQYRVFTTPKVHNR